MMGRGRSVTGANTMPLANRRTFGRSEDGSTPPPPSFEERNDGGGGFRGNGYDNFRDSPAPPERPGLPPGATRDSSGWGVVVPTGGVAYRTNGRFDASLYSNSVKRMYEGAPPMPEKRSADADDREGRPRKRKNRWGDSDAKVNIPGMPTTLPSTLTTDQIDMYQIHLRLEEIGRKLRTGDVVPPENERSPSPPPIYGPDGKRANTREVRYRAKLENERHKVVERAIKIDPNFRPPTDYKKPTKMQDKVYIPTREFPDINFIGLLIGPRGNTLKKLESESGAKVSIRGKGSVKEGKQSTASTMNEEEDLHCLVSADTEDKVQKAVSLIYKVIETAANVPETDNELKRMQLRELAALNGTLRDDENQACLNCGAIGHRKYDCPEQRNFTINLVCRICGSKGHTARDCLARNDPEMLKKLAEDNQELDSEIGKFMAELTGGGDGGGGGNGAGGIEPSGHYGPPRAAGGGGGSAPAPWKAAAVENAPWKTAAANNPAPPPPAGGPMPPQMGGWPPGPPGMGQMGGWPPAPGMGMGMGMGYPAGPMGGYPQAPHLGYGGPGFPPPPPMDLPPPPPPMDAPPPPPEDD